MGTILSFQKAVTKNWVDSKPYDLSIVDVQIAQGAPEVTPADLSALWGILTSLPPILEHSQAVGEVPDE